MYGGVEDCFEEHQSFPCLTQCSRLVSEQGVQSAMFLSSLLIKFHPCPRKKQKEKQTWILLSMSVTMIQLYFEIGKTAKQEQQKDHTLPCSISGLLNTNKI
jgi:hypothetical protein